MRRRDVTSGLCATAGLAVAGPVAAVSARAAKASAAPAAGRVGDAGVTLGERTIPWPRSISPQARAALRAAAERPAAVMPDPADTAAWKSVAAQMERGMAASVAGPDNADVVVATERLEGVTVHRARPHALDRGDRRLFVEIHGGGLVAGGGAFSRAGAVREALLHGVEALAIDYRMPPDHRFPAALDDCLAVYAAEVRARGAGNIIVGGASAGGYLTAALMLRARDAGVPMPRAALLLTPRVDMTESGDTAATLMGIDPVLQGSLAATAALYAGGRDLRHPYLSPLFGNLRGFPPTLLQSGTRDLYLSNTVRMHRALRAAGVAAELHVFEAMPHGRFGNGAPEDAELDAELKAFVARQWTRKG